MLEEAVKLLSTLVPEQASKPRRERLKDSAIQTSPGLDESTFSISQDKKSHSHTKAKALSQDNRCILGRRKLTRGHRRRKKRPLAPPQRRSCITDENSRPLVACTSQHNVSVQHQDLKAATNLSGVEITPISYWSQDSNSSACLTGIEPILEKLSAEATAETVNRENFWQLFDMDSELGF